MFIAHLPAGYIATKYLFDRIHALGIPAKWCLCAGLLGAIAPDADLLYFYLLDERQHNHHTYFTHFPIFWVGLLLASVIWAYASRDKTGAALAAIFSVNGLLHMVLDSVVGRIWWLAPFVDRPYSFATVAAQHDPWWLNFLLHWSFAIELLIVVWAIYVWHRSAIALPNLRGRPFGAVRSVYPAARVRRKYG